MKQYTKKDRERAILICAIAASSPQPTPYQFIAQELGMTHATGARAVKLAREAWFRALSRQYNALWTHETDAEAEALLREGWTPEETTV